MQIKKLEATNWLIHRAITVDCAPFTIIGGPNESGKSSLRDLIAFALVADLCRVESKGARDTMISSGATKGSVTVHIGDGMITRNIADGKIAKHEPIGNIEGISLPAVFPTLLDPAQFAKMTADDRRRLLTHVMKVPSSFAAVTAKLKDRGLDPTKLPGWAEAPFTEGGFPWAVKLATEDAKSNRSMWKGCTGETYGSDKAEVWTADTGDKPEGEKPDDDTLTETRSKFAALQQQKGALTAAGAARAKVVQQIAGWQRIVDLAAEMTEERKELIEERDSIAQTVKPDGHTDIACPDCGSVFTVDKKLKVQARQTNSLFSGETRLAAIDKHLALVPGAKHAIKDTPTPPIENDDGELDRQIADAEAAFKTQNELLNKWQHYENGNAGAQAKTDRAKGYHEQVKVAVKLAEAFEPAGIPGELLAAALDPFNTTLANLSARASWPVVSVNPDMEIVMRGRPYGLHAESVKWRADLILAVAVATHSGAKFVVADRFDVLDLVGRKQCILWVREAIKLGMLDTAIILGTFKEEPKMPPDIKVVWLGASANVA